MRRVLLGALLLAIVVGCGKKKATEVEGGGGGGEVPTDTTPYTIKVAERDNGTKWRITYDKTTTIKAQGGKIDETTTEKVKEDYIETILAMEDGKPTKLTRAYRYAQTTDKTGKYHDLPYSGKTVLIEKKGDLYTFTINGRELAPMEAGELVEEFRPSKRKEAEFKDRAIPKTPVRIGEKWDIPPDDVPEDGAKGTATGRLTKVYRDTAGRLCGVIAIELVGTLPPKPNSPTKVVFTATLDGAIDASSAERKVVMTTKSSWIAHDMKEGAITVSLDVVETKTRKAMD